MITLECLFIKTGCIVVDNQLGRPEIIYHLLFSFVTNFLDRKILFARHKLGVKPTVVSVIIVAENSHILTFVYAVKRFLFFESLQRFFMGGYNWVKLFKVLFIALMNIEIFNWFIMAYFLFKTDDPFDVVRVVLIWTVKIASYSKCDIEIHLFKSKMVWAVQRVKYFSFIYVHIFPKCKLLRSNGWVNDKYYCKEESYTRAYFWLNFALTAYVEFDLVTQHIKFLNSFTQPSGCLFSTHLL